MILQYHVVYNLRLRVLHLHSVLHANILASGCFVLLVYILSTSSLLLWCGSWLTLWSSPAHKTRVSTRRTIVQWESLTRVAKWGLPLSTWGIREHHFQVMILPYLSGYHSSIHVELPYIRDSPLLLNTAEFIDVHIHKMSITPHLQ